MSPTCIALPSWSAAAGGAVPDDVVVHHLPFPDLSHGHADDGAAPHEASWQKMMTEYSDEEFAEAASTGG